MNENERYVDLAGQSGGDTAKALKFLLLGMGIGAAIALLASPMSGEEVRSAFRHTFRSAFDGLTRQTRNLRDHGSNLLGFSRRRTAVGEYDEGAGI